MILDTCFLIDLQRELRDGKERGARHFLRVMPFGFPRISIVTWMEFAEGYGDEREDACRKFLNKFPKINLSSAIAWRASRIAKDLRAKGTVIGDHDIWIGATAIHLEVPVVTTNVNHFERIPGLTVLRYGPPAAP